MSIRSLIFSVGIAGIGTFAPLQAGTQAFSFDPESHYSQCDRLSTSQEKPSSPDDYDAAYVSLESQVAIAQEASIRLFIQSFLKEKLKMDVKEEQIVELNSGFGSGLSGNPLYQVLDEGKQPIIIVKIFSDSQGTFSKEFFSLRHFNTLSLQNLSFPRYLGADGKEIQRKKVFLLAMSYVDAPSFHQLYSRLFVTSVSSPERLEKLKTLLNAYEALGRGIAELHTSASTELLPIHPMYADTVQYLADTVFNCVLENSSSDNKAQIEKAKRRFFKQWAIEKNKRFKRSYMHGDANAGNYLYDFSKQRPVMIDLPNAASSIGQGKVPVGLPVYHLAEIQNQMLKAKALGLTEEEYAKLHEAFFSQYKARYPDMPSSESLDFFAKVNCLNFLYWHQENFTRFTPETKQSLEALYNVQLQFLLES